MGLRYTQGSRILSTSTSDSQLEFLNREDESGGLHILGRWPHGERDNASHYNTVCRVIVTQSVGLVSSSTKTGSCLGVNRSRWKLASRYGHWVLTLVWDIAMHWADNSRPDAPYIHGYATMAGRHMAGVTLATAANHIQLARLYCDNLTTPLYFHHTLHTFANNWVCIQALWVTHRFGLFEFPSGYCRKTGLPGWPLWGVTMVTNRCAWVVCVSWWKWIVIR